MRKTARTFALTALFSILFLTGNGVLAEPKTSFIQRIPVLLKTAHIPQPGKNVITIVLQAGEAGQLFPADSKTRAKADFQAILTDGRHTFLATLSPGGQSSLEMATPNLRMSDMEEISPNGELQTEKLPASLVGIPIIDKTLRLNPMTMDEGYVNTLTYIELIKRFHLLPASNTTLSGEYTKVIYRFVDEKDQWTKARNPSDGRPIEFLRAGLHLANFHPVKFLKNLESDDVEVLAIARSRYNSLNKVEKVKQVFGKSERENEEELFTSADVKTEPVAPFRVEIKWAKKTKAEKTLSKPVKGLENGMLLQNLLVKVYAAPKKFRGKELAQELEKVLDVSQLFRFMALNRLLENGDISDEYFWYMGKQKKSEQVRLGIMPQDGDDMFTGAHMFPTTAKQIGLILKGSAVAKKLGLNYGYIMNYEDPLFRIIRDDSVLFHLYLQAFGKVAGELSDAAVLEKLFGKISSQIEPYAKDADVLDRGRKDSRGTEYSPTSFQESIQSLKSRIQKNAVESLRSLGGTTGKPGDLEKARRASEQ